MSNLTSPEDFETVLRFAFGIADRGVPLTLVSMAMVSVAVESDPALGDPGWARDAEASLREVIAGRCRRTDRVAEVEPGRYRALLAVCNRQGALIYADRVVQACEDLFGDTGATVACGVATWTPEMSSASELIEASEDALERARKMGGDRIEIHVG